ncbi:MAG: hypothetical protein HY909_22935, partial [Deltaproteobacteria bacterium]|nr:hypothetical protein [Deltaproteobacteria bacterium]
MRRPWLLAAVVGLGCFRGPPRPTGPGIDARALRDSGRDTRMGAAPDALADPGDAGGVAPGLPPGLGGVAEAVRRGDFAEAEARLLRLPEATQGTLEGRYLHARFSVERGRHAQAAERLHALAEALPAFATELRRMEARALSQLGRHAEARALYARLADHGGGERDRAHAAVQAQQAGDPAAAAAVMRARADRPPPGLGRATAWRLAAQALEATGDGA